MKTLNRSRLFVLAGCAGLALCAAAVASPTSSTCDWFRMLHYGACVPPTNCIPAQYVTATCVPAPSGMNMAGTIGPVSSEIVAATAGTFFEFEFTGDLPCGLTAGSSVNVYFDVTALHAGGTLTLNGAMFMARVDDGDGNSNYLNGHMFPNFQMPTGTSYDNQFSSFPLAVGGPSGEWTMFLAFVYNPPEGAPATLHINVNMIEVTLVTPPNCPTDFNNDGFTTTPDLTFFLGRFGEPAVPGSAAARADFNSDGVVNTPDLVIFLGAFGTSCP
ncbi:MAG: hypothetical protein J0L61_10265 [Planctomycetes bacterium]|nr:hypothetical protein [Planctomycetota bacterium]